MASTRFMLEVDGEQIIIDESLFDFTDLTDSELAFLGRNVGPGWLVEGEPTAGMVAVMVAVKARRGRSWDSETTEQVIALLVAWLSGNLVPVET